MAIMPLAVASSERPALRLRTFGALVVEGRDGAAGAQQRRRLALLALLAGHGDPVARDPIARDRVVALLWPESDDERARHALAQLVYGVRRELGDAVIAGGPTTLRLDPDAIATDVHDFAAALASGDLERAVATYAGPFLDGFHLSGCVEFERWVDERRAFFAERAEEAIATLAARALDAGDAVRSVHWWRQLAALRPLDSTVALALMRAHAAAGDRASAIRHARVHAALVRDELDAAPDPSVERYAATLRAAPNETDRPNAPNERDPLGAPDEPDVLDAPSAAAIASPSSPVIDAPPRDLVVAGAPRAARRSWAMAVGGVLLVAGGVAAAVAIRERDATAPAGRRWVIVADVENATADSVFDRTVPAALAAALAQSPSVYVVPPDRIGQALRRMRRPGADSMLTPALAREIARREGIAGVAVPAVARAGEGYELSARIVDPATGGVLAFVATHADRRASVLDALDQLARRLRRELGESRRSVAANAVPLPRVTTASLDALQKLAAGERAFATDQTEIARSLWTQAVALDSGFAVAHAHLGMLAYWTNEPAAGDRHFARALAHADSLPERERLVIRASAARWRGERAAAATMLRTYLADHPDDLDLWRALGYDYMRLDQSHEAVAALGRVLALDSLDDGSWINLATAEKGLGRPDAALRAYRRAWAIAPARLAGNTNLNLEYAGTLVLAGQLDSAAAIVSLLVDADDAPRRARGLRSRAFVAMYRGDYAAASADLAQAIALSPVPAAGTSALRNRLLLATALDERGRAATAAAQRDSAYGVAGRIDVESTMLYWLGKALARGGDTRRTARLLDRLRAAARPGSATDRAALEALSGELLVARNRAADAIAHLDAAWTADSTAQVHESLAYALASSGAFDRAAALYERLGARREFGWEGQHLARLAPYWLGRVRERAGDLTGARDAYGAFVAAWPAAGADLRSVADARGRLAALRGDRPLGR